MHLYAVIFILRVCDVCVKIDYKNEKLDNSFLHVPYFMCAWKCQELNSRRKQKKYVYRVTS